MSFALYPYQATGAQWLTARAKAGLFDEPGLGKTAQAVHAADLRGLANILVIAPAAALGHWLHEFEHLSPFRSAALVLGGRARLPNVSVLITSYSSCWRRPLIDRLRARNFDGLILDEVHKLKNPDTLQGRAVFGRLGLAERISTVWALTGTPVTQRPGDMYAMLRAMAPDRLLHGGKTLSFGSFTDLYSVRDPRTDRIIGARNTKDLAERMRGFALRRRKVDVLPDLPPVRLSSVTLEVPDRLQADLAEASARVYADLGPDCSAEDLRQYAARSGAIATWRRQVGVVKAAAAVEYYRDELASPGAKKVFFAIHKDAIAILRAGFSPYGVVVVDGSVPAADRKAAETRFQTDPSCRVFIGQVQAAGVSLTLTAAPDLVFVERSWTPTDNKQAADRIHRIGQTAESVFITSLTLDNHPLDARVEQYLTEKETVLRDLRLS